MKKIALAITVMFSSIIMVAQENKKDHKHFTVEQKAQRSVDKLDKIVELNADQKVKVYSLALEKAKKAKAIREKYKGEADQKEALKNEMKAVRTGYNADLKALLSGEQMSKLEASRKQHQQAKKDRFKATPEERAQNMVNRLDKEVALSPEQKTKIYGLALTKAEKSKAIYEKYKGQEGQKETTGKELKAVRHEYKEAVKLALTPEQLTKWETACKDHKAGNGQPRKKMHHKETKIINEGK